jgi:tryptophanyl-tRNA synthetase
MSGVQPSGDLHIGNWLGAIRRWAQAQDEWEGFFCVVDLHALTEPRNAAELREKSLELAAIYLACGIDPARSHVFLQSHVPAHSELAWLLDCFLPMGWLERMTQFKVRARGHRERASVGLFNYPALMAADILLYDAKLVPAGDDQRQHVEVTRDVAQRLNRRFGNLLTLPEADVGSVGSRIMALDDPSEKMSKTVASSRPNHAIAILDSPDSIRRKLSRSVTDSRPTVTSPYAAGIANLIEIYRSVTDLSLDPAIEELGGKSYDQLKSRVADVLIAELQPIQERYAELRGDDRLLLDLLDQGAEAAASTAGRTLRRVQAGVGLAPRSRTATGRSRGNN